MYTVTEKSRIHKRPAKENPATKQKRRTKIALPFIESDASGVFRKKIEENDDIKIDRLCQKVA